MRIDADRRIPADQGELGDDSLDVVAIENSIARHNPPPDEMRISYRRGRPTVTSRVIQSQTAKWLSHCGGEFYELYDGYVYAFSTGTGALGLLCTRISTVLDTHTNEPCRAFGPSTIGVRRIDRATNVIPDGAVTCEDNDDSRTFILAPKLVVEVISPGTSVKRDRVTKLDIYQAIPSVEEYLMVDSRKVWACIYRRAPGDAWLSLIRTSLSDQVDVLSIGARLDLEHIYRGIEFGKRRSKRRRS